MNTTSPHGSPEPHHPAGGEPMPAVAALPLAPVALAALYWLGVPSGWPTAAVVFGLFFGGLAAVALVAQVVYRVGTAVPTDGHREKLVVRRSPF